MFFSMRRPAGSSHSAGGDHVPSAGALAGAAAMHSISASPAAACDEATRQAGEQLVNTSKAVAVDGRDAPELLLAAQVHDAQRRRHW